MIILDTHEWIWWAQADKRLPKKHAEVIKKYESGGLGVSAISLWEVAKAVEHGKLYFSISVEEWLKKALSYPGIQLLNLTPQIAVESTQLPENFYKDPADQIIVATARVFDIPPITTDDKIRNYPHVKLLP
jgi:PIN domain nuclease of toxin-antitoxin system